ncbi:MAG: hypothetical protein OEV78_03140 [Spirochaetia bacterium]|nr:hypothetical protein [Spirochaetia bacterium]
MNRIKPVDSSLKSDPNLENVYNENINLYKLYPSHVQTLRSTIQKQLKDKLGIRTDKQNDSPIVLCGHQIEFFHPGILSKEVLGSTAALKLNGSCISVILDHDPHDLIFNCPQIYSDQNTDRIRKLSFMLNTKSQSRNSLVHKKNWIDFLSQIPGNLEKHYEKTTLDQIRDNISILTNDLDTYPQVSDYITNTRLSGLKKLNLNLYPLKISEMVNLEGWRKFCDLIIDDLDTFIRAHNTSLDEYRIQHHIKNHAQPVPNLSNNEIPFWIIKNGKREKTIAENIKETILYPRAITLSIFLRLFVSDIFIHGTGGARYDQVTNSIIRKFFNVKPSSFLVKTASLQIPLNPQSSLAKFKNTRSIDEWLNQYRYFLFHPEKTKGVDVNLSRQRNELIELYNKTTGSKRNIRNELEENRIQILNQLVEYEDMLFNERDEIKKYTLDRNVLMDRSFPYFFYDMQTLKNDQSYEIIKYPE